MLETKPKILHLHSTLQDLTLHEKRINFDCIGEEAIKIFEQNPYLPGILIYQKNRFIGIVSRRRFFEYMSRPYSLELFRGRPFYALYQFLQTKFLVLPNDTSIVTASRLCLERSLELIYEPVIVKIDHEVFSILDVHELLLASSQIHELAIEALQVSQKELFEEKELAQVTLKSIGDAVITTNAFGEIESLNPMAEKLTGWQNHEVKNKPLSAIFKIFNEITREPVKNPIETVLEENCIVSLADHTILINREGKEIGIRDSAAPICAQNGQLIGAVLVFNDITEERKMAKQLSWQAQHDSLTGLINRHEFEQCLEEALFSAKSQNKKHTLCYLDLDRFKIINDTCGHLAGDELLRQITNLFKKNVRETDKLARLGGDEFALLLYGCPLESGWNIANKLCESVQKYRFNWQDKTFTIGVSIGITTITSDTPNASDVLNTADMACYTAKNKGRNRVCIYQENDSELTQQQGDFKWIEIINSALEKNNFILYYQTIAPLHYAQTVCEHYEVLLRLVDAQGNLIAPMAFIPTAERYNLMPVIDRWVIKTLFATQGQEYREGWQRCQTMNCSYKCLYTINLSGASINDEGFIEFLHQQFTLYQIPPEIICFEITETVAIANIQKATEFMENLKQLGCRFALDDFGSGMSSFTYLKNLPVDYLKIDGSFVKDIVIDPIASTMVEAINRIGEVMGIQTIAEFVENDDILIKLRNIGVDYAQGYGIAKPKPFEAKKLHISHG